MVALVSVRTQNYKRYETQTEGIELGETKFICCFKIHFVLIMRVVACEKHG